MQEIGVVYGYISSLLHSYRKDLLSSLFYLMVTNVHFKSSLGIQFIAQIVSQLELHLCDITAARWGFLYQTVLQCVVVFSPSLDLQMVKVEAHWNNLGAIPDLLYETETFLCPV